VPTVLLVRHGRTDANSASILAGRTPGTRLDEMGRAQALSLAERLAGVPLGAVVSSPLERCLETAAALTSERGRPAVDVDDRLTECDYGEWTGRPMKELVKEDLWRIVQAHPAAVRFPGGEAMAEMAARAVGSVRAWDTRVTAESGPDAVWLAVAHGDVIKSVLADALGVHLDAFQRIVVDPASLSVVRYTPERSYVLAMNTVEGSLGHLARQQELPEEKLGGGAGPTVPSP
jgi:2,3-bisphosphoglycerate-dependent phosphoglycerate mutase